MIDLFKQFFSFDKMMKDRLVASFFFLGLVVVVMIFLGTILEAIGMMKYQFFAGLALLIWAFFRILFLFVGLRLACELMVAIFHINDNLAPDGGKSDTADLDVFEAARDAATKAASSATSATKSVVEKTKTKLHERKDGKDDFPDYPDYEDTTAPKPKKRAARKPVAKKSAPKKSVTKKPAAKKPVAKKAPKKKPVAKTTTRKATAKKPAAKKPATKKAPVKKRTPKK